MSNLPYEELLVENVEFFRTQIPLVPLVISEGE